VPAIGSARRDYSPSRTRYRIERIWLTPVYRALIRTGLPLAIVVAAAALHFSRAETRADVAQWIRHTRAMIENRPEFAVQLMRIDGGSDAVAEQVRAAVPLTFPESSLRLDLALLKRQVEAVAAVKQAHIFLRRGILEVQIVERRPAAIWRGAGRHELVDAEGHLVGLVAGRAGHESLPLLLGPGAQARAGEALDIIAAAGPVRPRIRAVRRMGRRRWDVLLDRDQVIRLPVNRPVAALERLIALHKARDVLGRDVILVDLRDRRRPVLRLSGAAVNALRRLRTGAGTSADQEREI